MSSKTIQLTNEMVAQFQGGQMHFNDSSHQFRGEIASARITGNLIVVSFVSLEQKIDGAWQKMHPFDYEANILYSSCTTDSKGNLTIVIGSDKDKETAVLYKK